jgi:hypothetical protein
MGTMPMAINSVQKIVGDWNTTIEGTNTTVGKASLKALGFAAAIAGIAVAAKTVERRTVGAGLDRLNTSIATMK